MNAMILRSLSPSVSAGIMSEPSAPSAPRPPAAIDHVCIEAESLRRTLSELQCLRASSARLTLAMATAGHDIRQRLQILLGTIELLTGTTDSRRRAALAAQAKSLTGRLSRELEQLAYEADRDHKHFMPTTFIFSIISLLSQLQVEWQSEAAAKGLQYIVGQAHCLVASDHRLLAVIMNNLVGNAIRHTYRGRVDVHPLIEGGCLVLEVADTGPGIEDGDLRRSFAFSPRSGTAETGMGLGLSIARQTADLLGHRLDVVTSHHSGTTVRLHVSLAETKSLGARV